MKKQKQKELKLKIIKEIEKPKNAKIKERFKEQMEKANYKNMSKEEKNKFWELVFQTVFNSYGIETRKQKKERKQREKENNI